MRDPINDDWSAATAIARTETVLSCARFAFDAWGRTGDEWWRCRAKSLSLLAGDWIVAIEYALDRTCETAKRAERLSALLRPIRVRTDEA